MELYSDDVFYDNLTLGLIKVLANAPGVKGVQLEKKLPCDRNQISAWEQRHSCLLPTDMKQFYLATDGFELNWSYEYAGEVLPMGHMKINGINDLKRIGGVKTQGDCDSPSLLDLEVHNPKNDPNRPHFCVRCKIFDMDSCEGNGRVCLVYPDKYELDLEKREKPKIWLLDRSFEWHFLAETFTQYFRMMLVHQGLPQWQFRFTTMGLTQFSEQMMLLIAPHLLQPLPSSIGEWPDSDSESINILDLNVFKNTKDKSSKSKREAKLENSS